NKIHDEWICCNCGFAGKGITPKNCPICNGEKFEVNTWLCQDCMDTAKNETIKLLEILRKDFGFSNNEIRVFFSGHRGYHIHIENEDARNLDAIQRKEIVDYVCGIGFDVNFQSPSIRRAKNMPSWYERINKELQTFIINACEKDLERLGLRKKVSRTLLERKNEILKSSEGADPWKLIRGVGPKTWRKIFDYCIQKGFVKIDTVVTADVHRLVRLTNTLHGKTGFKKVELPISRIDDFDPFKDAIAFRKGTVTVLISNSPRFRIGDEIFGPYKNVKVEMPTAAAVLLICKGRAEVPE
ncbi:MAG: DNA primase small subunit domain-containing protein, partial [Candidatus Bathyarchaeia archaeon]